jgi:PAS domain S-box-containing protein
LQLFRVVFVTKTTFFICSFFIFCFCPSSFATKSGEKEKIVSYQNQSVDSIYYSYYGLAKIHFGNANYDSSVHYLLHIVSAGQTNNLLLAKSHALLGVIYTLNEDFFLSEKHLFNALDLCSDTDSLLKSQIYSNIGKLYFSNSDFDNALLFFKKSAVFSPDKTVLSYQIALSNIGGAFYKLNLYDSALVYIEQAHQLSVQLNDCLGELICMNNFASVYRAEGNHQQAILYYTEALSIIKDLQAKEDEKIILLNLSELYEDIGDFKQSLVYYKNYSAIKDSLFNDSKTAFMVEAQEKYNTVEQKKEIAELKITQQIENARFVRFIYFSTIGAMFILILIVWFKWKVTKEKAEAELASMAATMAVEKKLKESEARYRFLFERNLAGVYRSTLDYVYLECNDAFAKIIGFNSAKDVVGKQAKDLYITASHPEFLDVINSRQGKLSSEEVTIRKKNGEELILIENASIIKNHDGNPEFIQGTIIDITQRKKIEQEKEKLANLNEKIIESSDQLFYIVKVVDTSSFFNPFIYISHKEYEFFGVQKHELLQNNQLWLKYIHPDDVNYVQAATRKMYLTKKPASLVYRRINPTTNNYFWIYDYVCPVLDSTGNVVELYGSLKNITELKNKEAEIIKINHDLIKIEENERIRIAYEIHDGLMQTLAAISMHIDKVKTNQEFEDLSLLIKSAILEAKNITNDLFPKDLHENGLVKSISILTETLTKTKEIEVSVDASEKFNQITLSEHMQFNVYRIIQESLNNTIKHASATRASIYFCVENNQLIILFSNNGTAISNDILNKPTCFISIKRRINVINGTFELAKNVSGEVAFRFVVPTT